MLNSTKVLLISDEYPPSGGGAGIVARQIKNHLYSSKCNLTLISGDSGLHEREIEHVQVTQKRIIWIYNYFKALNKCKAVSEYPIIVLNDYLSAYIAGMFFSKKTLSKCIILIHGTDAKFFFGKRTNKHLLFQYKFFYKRTIKHCKKIVSVSCYAQEMYHKYIPENIKNIVIKKSEISYTGIDYKSLEMKDKNFLGGTNLEQSEDTNILLTVARLTTGKGFKTMLVAYDKLLKNSNKKYHWYIAGDGDFKADFVDSIKSLGLENNVTLLGRLTTEELIPYYKGADCFWLLSPDETFGLVYLEASYFNLGSIGYCKTGVKEAITEGVNGYYYESFDDFEHLIEKCKRLKKVRKPMTICSKFQISTFVESILN